MITADLEQLCRETVRIDRKDMAELRLGVLSTYSGDEFNRAIAAFSEKYPKVEITVVSGNHEDLYACLNYGEAYCPKEIENQAICLDGDTAEVLEELK